MHRQITKPPITGAVENDRVQQSDKFGEQPRKFRVKSRIMNPAIELEARVSALSNTFFTMRLKVNSFIFQQVEFLHNSTPIRRKLRRMRI
nr:hypothetical protein [Tanacetum cinerariifolium]